MRKKFIRQVQCIIDNIAVMKGISDTRRCHLVAFSILVMLDGEQAGMPPFAVRPFDEYGKQGKDIAGKLHELLSKGAS